MGWLLLVTGGRWPTAVPTTFYNEWSGFISCLGMFASALAFTVHALVTYRHKNCEVHRCWRLGRHTTAAGHRVCRRHHPEDPLTAAKVTADHHAAR